jgi:hypothetical protein
MGKHGDIRRRADGKPVNPRLLARISRGALNRQAWIEIRCPTCDFNVRVTHDNQFGDGARTFQGGHFLEVPHRSADIEENRSEWAYLRKYESRSGTT